MKTVFLIGFLPHPRIMKRIKLALAYSCVHVICWDRQNGMVALCDEGDYTQDIIAIPAAADPLKRLLPYARFRRQALRLLRKQQPDILHVQGLDMLQIACAYQRRFDKNVEIVYEVADLHRLLVDRQQSMIGKLAQRYLIAQDRKLTKQIALLIVTAQRYYDTYFASFVPKEKVMYFPNVPDLRAFAEYRRKPWDAQLTVGFIGGIRYKKQIHNLLTAAEACDIRVLLAGYEIDDNEIKRRAKAMPNVEWVGRFDFQLRAAELYSKCDVIYSVYDADKANVRVALPNKLYESVHCELPIIVAKGTYLAELVEDWGVGFAVDHRTPDELTEQLRNLAMHPERMGQYRENCQKLQGMFDLEKYNAQLRERIERLWRE